MTKGLQAALYATFVLAGLANVSEAQTPNQAQSASKSPDQGRAGSPSIVAYIGGCHATVTWKRDTPGPAAPLPFTVYVNNIERGDDTLALDKDSAVVKLGVVLERTNKIYIRYPSNPGSKFTEEVEAVVAPKGQEVSTDDCPARRGGKKATDERGDLDMLVYNGVVIDTFTPAKNAFYVQGDDETKSRAQYVVGLDFSYRLTKEEWPVQLWLSGETVYGAKTSETVEVPGAPNPGNVFRKVIDASSLEAYVAPRFEFWTLKKEDSPLALYATARFGLMALQNATEVAESHHIGAGGIVIDGTFEGSLFEIGWGKSSQFVNPSGEAKWDRLKIDTLAAVALGSDTGLYGFFQVYVDMPLTNRNEKATAIQTFIGVELELTKFAKLWGGK